LKKERNLTLGKRRGNALELPEIVIRRSGA